MITLEKRTCGMMAELISHKMEDNSYIEKLQNSAFDLIQIEEAYKTKNEFVSELNTGRVISHILFKVLEKYKTAKHLSANQIGIYSQVGVINVREPLYFINPIILDVAGPIEYLESDNLFPGKLASTKRYGRVLISSLNFKSPIWMGVKTHQLHLLQDPSALAHPVIEECVAVQHVIDSINNITMFDRTEHLILQKSTHGRNEWIDIIKDDKELRIKYKRLDHFLADGWKLKNE